MSQLVNMNTRELREAVAHHSVLMVAIGAVEYHGSQLPLGTDLFIPKKIIESAEATFGDSIVIAPSISVSPTGFAVSGPELGTMDVDPGVFAAYTAQLLWGYQRMGFEHVLALVHHQSGSLITILNAAIKAQAFYAASRELGEAWWSLNKGNPPSCRIETCSATLGLPVFNGHGGRGETEAMLALYPNLVRFDEHEEPQYKWNLSAGLADGQVACLQWKQLEKAWVKKLSDMLKSR